MTYLSEGCLDLTGYQAKNWWKIKGLQRYRSWSVYKTSRSDSGSDCKQQPYVEYRILINQVSRVAMGKAVASLTAVEVLGLEGFITDIPSATGRKQLYMKAKTPSESTTAYLWNWQAQDAELWRFESCPRKLQNCHQHLGIERVSVWLYNDERSECQCIDLYGA